MEDAAQALYQLSQCENKGIFHLGGQERINRYDFGRKFASLFGYSPDLLKPVLMKDVPSQATRAADCSLNSQKIIELIRYKPCNVASGLWEIGAKGLVIRDE